jgi:maltooligosyltrehalose trehalohydrolase
VHILEQIATHTRALEAQTGRSYDIIAESDLNNPRLVRSVSQGGYGLDGVWADDFHHALHALLTGERAGYYEDFGSIADLARALTQVYAYDGRYSKYRHRTHGRPIGDLPASRFVIATQNHDQVGNRARGERLVHLVGPQCAKLAAAVLLIAPAVPLLFLGEEWAASTPFQYFTDHQDPKLAEAVSEGRKREFAAFGWPSEDLPDPQDIATFLRSRLDWSELSREPHAEMLTWYRSLIALRRATRSLTDGRLDTLRVEFDEARTTLIMSRGQIVLAANLGGETELQLDESLRLMLRSDDASLLSEGRLYLPPDSVAILRAGS